MSERELRALFSEMGPILVPFIRRRAPPETVYTLVRYHIEEAMWHLFRAATIMSTVDPAIGSRMAVTAHATAARSAGILSDFEKKVFNGSEASPEASEEEE